MVQPIITSLLLPLGFCCALRQIKITIHTVCFPFFVTRSTYEISQPDANIHVGSGDEGEENVNPVNENMV